MQKLLFTTLLTLGITISTLLASADAGPEQYVSTQDTVQLDGTNSTLDNDGKRLRYKWKQLSTEGAPKIKLIDRKTATPTFIAPEVEETTELLFRLRTTELYNCRGEKGSSCHKGNKGSHNKHHKKRKKRHYCKKYKTYDDVSIFVSPKENNITGITVSGTVTDTNGSVISNALVTIGSQMFTTDINGNYILKNVIASAHTSVNVTHPDFLANSRIVDINLSNVTLDITLDTPKASLTFDSTVGAIVAEESGASVTLPANSYIDENGLTYAGSVTVKMSYHAITTQSGRATFPGTFEGIDNNGSTFPIQSYGFMNIELTDTNGNPLNLDGNATATLKYPIDSSLENTPTIPLWYYDKTQGYWVQEGEAILENYSYYVGTVKHFTSWNLDAKGTVAKLTGCVEDINGTRIPDALVQFRSINWDSYLVPTDKQGEISVIRLLAEADLTISAYKTINNIFYTGTYPSTINLSSGENRTLNSCIVLQETNIPNTGTITIRGNIKFYNTQYSDIKPTIIVDGLNTKLKILDTSITEGDFSLTIPLNKYDKGFHIYSPGCDQGQKFFLEEDTYIYDVGQIAFIPVC